MDIPVPATVASAPRWRPVGAIAPRLLGEAAGALGDLGTFVPIAIGMVVLVGMDAATILVLAGLMNIVTGLVFRLPIAVQPMKAIAALAIAGALTAGEVYVAGITVGVCLVVLASLGLIERLDRLVPRPVLSGIQLAVAAKLLLKAGSLGLVHPSSHALRPLWGLEGWGVFVGGVVVLLCLRRRWQWAAVGLLLLGLLAAAVKQPALLSAWRVSLWRPGLAALQASAISGAWRGGLAQLPLTLLNSVFAASVLAGALFPAAAKRTTPTRLALSVAMMNLLACPLGGMPTCHGSGGMAGQFRFGARTGLSMVMLGAAKLALGLLFGAAALAWMRAFPVTMLGVFLLVAGAALARASGFWREPQMLLTAAVTVGVYLGSDSLLAGFAAGWVAHALLTRDAPPRTPEGGPAPAGPGSPNAGA